MVTDSSLLAGPRAPRYTFTLLTQDERKIRQLNNIVSWNLDLSATSRLGDSGSITLVEDKPIFYLGDRLKVTYDPGVKGVEPWNLGVFLFSEAGLKREPSHETQTVQLISKLAVLDDDALPHALTVPIGAKIITTVEAIINSTGETHVVYDESDAEAREPIQFEAGTSKLTVVNQLLDAAGYWAVHVDGDGNYRLTAYRPPAQRPVEFEFRAGDAAIHSGEWSRTEDLTGVPNRVICRTAGTGDTHALVGLAFNLDLDSPLSYQRRGRWITRVYDVEASSQKVIDQMAARRLASLGNPVAKIQMSHAPIPVMPRERVRFQSGGVDVTAIIQKTSISSPGYMASSELKEVK